jgi:hypothetical protein
VTTPALLSTPSPEILAALHDVDGVDAVVGEPSGALRLDLHPNADATRVDAAVTALLADRFGIAGATTDLLRRMGPVAADGRLTLDDLELSSRADHVVARLAVSFDGRSAPGAAEAETAAEAVTTAILLALEELTEDAVIGTIEGARVDSDGIARVRLRLDVDGAEEPAEAEAAVLRSEPQAVVRAVLTAVEPHLPS